MEIRKTFIIAEAGVNHNGDIYLAERMVDAAAASGADAVKFQTYVTENLVSRDAPLADYQAIEDDDGVRSAYDLLKKYELSRSDHERLLDRCRRRNIQFISSPFDLESIDLLNDLGVTTIKMPSGEIDNLPYIRKIGRQDKDIILSTGMATLAEIAAAVEVLQVSGTLRSRITLLHCNTAYPTPYADVNLNAIKLLGFAFPGIRIGYSDHTRGIEVALAAVTLGAAVIEKHFTMDRNMEGPDHKASIGVSELSVMIRSIRNIELAFGNGEKIPSPSEGKNRKVVRKSIVASRAILKDEIFSQQNLTVKRPGTGLTPMMWDWVIGRRAGKNYEKEDFIEI